MAVTWFVSLCKIMVKNKIRKSLLEQGQLLSKEFIKESNIKIQNIAINEIDIESSKNTLLYFPYKKEISVELIIKTLWKYDNNIYMPRIVSKNKLKFNRLKKLEVLKKNKYGIKEITSSDYLSPMSFNTMFIPFVGIDKNGYRLGYGGGYFDRALQNVKKDNNKILIIGLGYEYQVVKGSFGEAHDIRYDAVITEKDIHFFK